MRHVYQDLWVLDTASWTWQELCPSSALSPWPSARSAMSMAFHEGRLLIFGGKAAQTWAQGQFLADLWIFDESSTSWCASRWHAVARNCFQPAFCTLAACKGPVKARLICVFYLGALQRTETVCRTGDVRRRTNVAGRLERGLLPVW
jgi:Kelch motif